MKSNLCVEVISMTTVNILPTTSHVQGGQCLITLKYPYIFFSMRFLEIPFSMFEGPFLLLFLVMLLIWCIALVAIANGRFNDNTTKLCWFLLVLFLSVVGVLLFVIWGRKEVFSGRK